MLLTYASLLGAKTINFVSSIGDFTLFGKQALTAFITKPLHRKQLLMQMNVIGVGSFPIVFATGVSVGLAFAFQSYLGFSKVHAEEFTGLAVTIGMARELGPVFTGLMVTGRMGSAIAAELGTMKISEQIDALKTLCVDPFYYLVVPRILAATIMMPFAAIFTMIFGMAASYILCIYSLDINSQAYMSIIQEYMELKDITGGLIKAAFFGFIFSWIGTYIGYHTSGGARGVGISTTQSVVLGSIIILISNYVLGSLLHSTGLS